MSNAPTLAKVVELPRHPRKCSATNNMGEPCGQWAIVDGSVCKTHGGSAPQVREAARRKAVWHAPRAVEVLVELMENPLTEDNVRRAAARDILDRAGVGPHSSLEVQQDPHKTKWLKLWPLSDEELLNKIETLRARVEETKQHEKTRDEHEQLLAETKATIAEQERLGVPDPDFMAKLLKLRNTLNESLQAPPKTSALL